MTAKLNDVSHYRILAEVGSGGLGQVFKAVDQRTGRLVAVKFLHQRYQTSRKFLGIFHRELLIISRLRHKHIVEFLDANFDPPNCYIVTEFVDGWSLHALMKRFPRLPPMIALCITIDILQGIDYLHLHDTIHSDLSAPNVLLDKTGRVLVTDFGLAAQDKTEDYRNYMVGTPGYYSPEHVTDTGIVAQSDLYCVGLLLYQMLTGEKAVPPSKNRKDILRSMKRIDFNRIVCTDKRLQGMLRKLLKVVLRLQPSRRYPNAEAMIFDVYSILKMNHIRFARYAIHQFLLEQKLTAPLAKKINQDIYKGFYMPSSSTAGGKAGGGGSGED